MRLAGVGELPLLEILRKRFSGTQKGLLLGIGDDAAVIRPSGGSMLLTTDMMVEGVHFDFAYTTPYQLGFKLVTVNVSDIYAMGGRPLHMLLDFAAPGGMDVKSFDRLFDGIGAAAKKYGLSLIGGDMSSSDKVVLSATVVGGAKRVLRRTGARAGDGVFVTGNLGNASCGMELLRVKKRRVEIEKGKKTSSPLPWKVMEPLLRRHLMPTAVDPRNYREKTTAMIDISDGLLIDLSRLCSESRVGARLYEELIPLAEEMREAAAYLGRDPMEFALSGGEDYELLFTSSRKSIAGAFRIGEVTGRGMTMVDSRGRIRKISAKGYQHFGVQG